MYLSTYIYLPMYASVRLEIGKNDASMRLDMFLTVCLVPLKLLPLLLQKKPPKFEQEIVWHTVFSVYSVFDVYIYISMYICIRMYIYILVYVYTYIYSYSITVLLLCTASQLWARHRSLVISTFHDPPRFHSCPCLICRVVCYSVLQCTEIPQSRFVWKY